jgi:hypothetical protein
LKIQKYVESFLVCLGIFIKTDFGYVTSSAHDYDKFCSISQSYGYGGGYGSMQGGGGGGGGSYGNMAQVKIHSPFSTLG